MKVAYVLGDTSAKNSTTVLKSAAENDIIKTDTKAINEGESKSPTKTRGSPEGKASGNGIGIQSLLSKNGNCSIIGLSKSYRHLIIILINKQNGFMLTQEA